MQHRGRARALLLRRPGFSRFGILARIIRDRLQREPGISGRSTSTLSQYSPSVILHVSRPGAHELTGLASPRRPAARALPARPPSPSACLPSGPALRGRHLEAAVGTRETDQRLQGAVRRKRQAEAAARDFDDDASVDRARLEMKVPAGPGVWTVIHDANPANRDVIARRARIFFDRERELRPGQIGGDRGRKRGAEEPSAGNEIHDASFRRGGAAEKAWAARRTARLYSPRPSPLTVGRWGLTVVARSLSLPGRPLAPRRIESG